jgi:hypothetical protein
MRCSAAIHVGAGVDGGIVAGVHRGAIAPAQRHRLVHLGIGVGAQGDRAVVERVGDDAVERLDVALAAEGAQHPMRLGAHMVHAPRRPVAGHGFDDRFGLLTDPFASDRHRPGAGAAAGHRGDQTRQFAMAAEHLDGLGTPGLPLLAVASQRVFRLPRFQGGLLGQRQHLHRGGFAPMRYLEGLRQLAHTMLHRGPA